MAKIILNGDIIPSPSGDGTLMFVITIDGLSVLEAETIGMALKQPVADAVTAATSSRRGPGSDIKDMFTGEVTPLRPLS